MNDLFHIADLICPRCGCEVGDNAHDNLGDGMQIQCLHADVPPIADAPRLAIVARSRAAIAERFRLALLAEPPDGTCRLCGNAPTDARALCATCIDELTDAPHRVGGAGQ